MLEQEDAPYSYREYRKEPLTVEEIKDVLGKLGLEAHQVLRRRDRAFGELGLTGEESEARLVELMAQHPTLLQRPIAVTAERAVIGRPVERILELL